MTDPRVRTLALALALPTLLLGSTGTAAADRREATAQPSEIDAFVASLEGAWLGPDNDTPLGKMDFVTLFEWEADGSLHSRSSLNRETFVDLRFWKDEAGRWMLTEEAGLEGMGVQSHDLAPAGLVAGTGRYRWVHTERPEFLVIELALEGDTLVLDTFLRGEPHVAFRLDRQSEETRAAIRTALLEQAQQSPEEGTSIDDVIAMQAEPATVDADDPIATARASLAAAPDDAGAHLELAKTLGAAMDVNPASAPRYAFEMLEALTTAVDLDPGLVEAYHWLVGYYLSAPPIAGGSVAEARAVARRLAEIVPEEGRALLDQIAARENGTSAASAAGGDSR
jgi:hypothetical protein